MSGTMYDYQQIYSNLLLTLLINIYDRISKLSQLFIKFAPILEKIMEINKRLVDLCHNLGFSL